MAEIAEVEVAAKKTMKSKKHQFIKQVKIGDNIDGVYYLANFFEKTAKNGNKYTDVVLRDRSGVAANIKFWGTFTSITKGSYVQINATVEEYQGQPQIIVNKIAAASRPTDLMNYQAVSETIEEDQRRLAGFTIYLKDLSAGLQDETCIHIVNELLNDETKKLFVESCASLRPYYGKVGGLLARTVKIVKLCAEMGREYDFDNKEQAILCTAAMIQGIGCLEAFEVQDCTPVETKKGILVGASQLTLQHFQNATKKLGVAGVVLNGEVLLRLEHALTCVNGAVKPMTKEAIILNEVYRIDRELAEAFNFIAQDENGTEFTAFDPVLRRRYLKK